MRPELGTDFYCYDDVTPDLRAETDGRRTYLQAMYRRLAMPFLFYSEGGYGVGIIQWVLDQSLTAQEIGDAITINFMQDERTQRVDVEVLNATIRIKCTTHADPSFPLTLTIDRVKGALINESLG